ncbi:hypothetical protein Emag_006831 [Eimeria magna]
MSNFRVYGQYSRVYGQHSQVYEQHSRVYGEHSWVFVRVAAVSGESISTLRTISNSSSSSSSSSTAAFTSRGVSCLGAMAEPSVIANEAFEAFFGFSTASTPSPHLPSQAPTSIVPVDQQQLSAAAAAAVAAAAAAAVLDKGVAKEEETGSPVPGQRAEPFIFVGEEGDDGETTIPGSLEAWQLTARQLLQKPVWGLGEVVPACMSLMVLVGGGDDPSLAESIRARLRAEGDSVAAKAFEALVNKRELR